MNRNILKKGWSALLAVALGITILAGAIVVAPAARADSTDISLVDRNEWMEYGHYWDDSYNLFSDKKLHPTSVDAWTWSTASEWHNNAVPYTDIDFIIDNVLTKPMNTGSWGNNIRLAR